jgi:hypothetical protein
VINSDEAFLLRGNSLIIAHSWLDSRGDDLNERETLFISQSVQLGRSDVKKTHIIFSSIIIICICLCVAAPIPFYVNNMLPTGFLIFFSSTNFILMTIYAELVLTVSALRLIPLEAYGYKMLSPQKLIYIPMFLFVIAVSLSFFRLDGNLFEQYTTMNSIYQTIILFIPIIVLSKLIDLWRTVVYRSSDIARVRRLPVVQKVQRKSFCKKY